MTRSNSQTKKPRQWHPAFFATIQIELKEDRNNLRFENEHQLTAKPLIVDVIIIKKEKNIPIKKNIGKIFRKYNLFEYKSPTDYLSIDDYYKTFGYACFYKSDTPKVNSIKIHEISISFVCEGYPRKLMKHLRKFKHYEVKKKYRGIYYVTGAIIPIQFIIRNQLSEQENLWLKGLTDKLEADGTAELLINDYGENYHNPLYETVLQMIMGANEDIFNEEANLFMCEALYELFKKRMQKERDEELIDKYNEIRNEGRILGMLELYQDDGISLDDAIVKICQKLKDDSSEMRSRIESLWHTQMPV